MAKKHRTKRKTGKTFFYDVTVDLHGMTLEEAIRKMDSYIYSGEYNTILVVHGIGKGILRRGLRQYFKENSYVKESLPGESLNLPGAEGITVIYL